MIVLPNMGLVKWDSLSDYFSHVQLGANFESLDNHDHTSGKGKQIPYGGLAEQSVGPSNLREGAFTAAALANETIPGTKIAPEAITATKIGAGAVTETKLGNASVTSQKFKPTAGIKTVEADKSLTESFAEITLTGGNLSITPVVPSNLFIWAQFYIINPAGSTTTTRFVLDGTGQRETPYLWTTEVRAYLPHYDMISLTAASHTISVQAKCVPVVGTHTLVAAGSRFTYMLVAQ